MKHVWQDVVFIPSSSASPSLYLPSFPFLSFFAAGVSSPSLDVVGGCDVRFPPLPSSPLLCVERRQRGREARWSGVGSGVGGRTDGGPTFSSRRRRRRVSLSLPSPSLSERRSEGERKRARERGESKRKKEALSQLAVYILGDERRRRNECLGKRGRDGREGRREGGENDVRIYDGADDEGSGGGGGEGREKKERKEGRTKKKSCRRSSEGRLSCEREQRWIEK